MHHVLPGREVAPGCQLDQMGVPSGRSGGGQGHRLAPSRGPPLCHHPVLRTELLGAPSQAGLHSLPWTLRASRCQGTSLRRRLEFSRPRVLPRWGREGGCGWARLWAHSWQHPRQGGGTPGPGGEPRWTLSHPLTSPSARSGAKQGSKCMVGAHQCQASPLRRGLSPPTAPPWSQDHAPRGSPRRRVGGLTEPWGPTLECCCTVITPGGGTQVLD